MKKRSLKWMVALLTMVFVFVMFGPKTDAYAEDTEPIEVEDWAELKYEVNHANSPVTIKLVDSEDPLSPGFTAQESDEYITIESGQNITIDFNGHTLDGTAIATNQHISGAFHNNGSLKLINGSIYGCAGLYSGAVVNLGDLIVEDIVFQDNVSYLAGGAINNLSKSTCSIKSAKFYGNITSKQYTSDVDSHVAVYNAGIIELGDPDKSGTIYFGEEDCMYLVNPSTPIEIKGPLAFETPGGYYSSTINISPSGAGVITSNYATHNTEDGNVLDPKEFFKFTIDSDIAKYSIGLTSAGEVEIFRDLTTTYNITYDADNGIGEESKKTLMFKNADTDQYILLGDGVTFTAPRGKELAGWKIGDKVYDNNTSINLRELYKDEISDTDNVNIHVNILAQWRDLPKLTVKATSIDGSAGINDYITFGATGSSILSLLSNDKDFINRFTLEGYEYSGILPKDISQYNSRADLPSQDELEEMTIEGDTTVYAFMAKEISSVEMSVKAPVCGQVVELAVEGNPKTQTNKPEVTLDKDAVYAVDDSEIGCVWADMSDYSIPFEGKISGGSSYLAYADMISDLGYIFDGAAPTVTGGEVVENSVIMDDNHELMSFQFTVNAVHEQGDKVNDKVVAPTCEESGHHDEVVKCKGCDYLFEDTRVSDINDEALGHDWGEWVVTREATETEEGEEERTCKRDESHKEYQPISKKDPSAPDDKKDDKQDDKQDDKKDGGKQDGGKQDGGSQDGQSGVKVGDTIVVSGMKYKVLSENTVSLIQAKNAKTVTVPATVKNSGKTYKVTRIGANAFKKSKAAKVIIKTKNLKKSTVKNSLKGSKVKSIKIKVGKKKVNKTYLKKYRKIFTKKNSGKKIKITL